MIYVDYEVPINDIRDEGERIVNASPLWDKVAYGVQVTDWKNDVVEVRILVSSDSAPHLWDLRCELREKILLFLQQRETVFPRQRLTPLGAKGITLSGNGEQ